MWGGLVHFLNSKDKFKIHGVSLQVCQSHELQVGL